MLVRAEGLFRLDAVVADDTLRVLVRNLSGVPLQMDPDSPAQEPHFVVGEVGAFEPAQGGVRFTLGERADQVAVEARLAILRFPERGMLRITAQAVVRRPPSAGAPVWPSPG
jgi:hypothetical protein